MRVSFIEPSVEDFSLLFEDKGLKRGGAIEDISVFTNPRRGLNGGGLFSLLSGLVKRVAPVVKRIIMPSALEFGQNILSDLQTGKSDIKSALKERGMQALKSTGRRFLTGRGSRKRKRKAVKNKRKKTKRLKTKNEAYKDVFDMM